VEITVTRYAFVSRADNVTIRGLIIEKYYSPPQNGAVQGALGRGWLMEDSEFRLNSGAGISIGTNGKVINSKIHHNGQLGIGAVGSDILIEGNEISSNNIYGFDYSWEAGGVKIAKSERVTLRRNHTHHNGGAGLWCDIDCADVIFEANTVEYNDNAGIFYEISKSGIIRDNILRENGMDNPGWFWGPDILIAASEDVQVYNNNITVRRGGNGIILIDQNRQKKRGEYYKTRNNYVHGNHIKLLGPGSIGGVSDAIPGAVNYAIIESGNNRFDDNTYSFSPPSMPVFIWGGKKVDLAAFRSLGQELNGRMRQ
jgi:parallel beta-helix repeat protein